MSSFPKPHNFTKAVEADGQLTFSYLDSMGIGQTETRPKLDAKGILRLVTDRMQAFRTAGLSSREGESLRRDRKYVAAHPESILRAAWDQASAAQHMELSMMLAEESHFGISDPHWLAEETRKKTLTTRRALPVAEDRE